MLFRSNSTKIKQITLPSTLKILGDHTFYDCRNLSQILFRQKAPTAAGSTAPQETHCGEVVLPDTLEKVGGDPFGDCPEVKAIWTGNSSVANGLRKKDFHTSVAILPAISTMVGDRSLWDFRKQKKVVIPEGV